MSNVIALLEAMGADAGYGSESGPQLEQQIASAGLDAETREALLRGDARALNRLLGGRGNVVCGLFPAEPDEEQQPERLPDEESPEEAPEEPGQDDRLVGAA
jgi:hypothetical protein